MTVTTTTTTTETSGLDVPKVFRKSPRQTQLAAGMLEKLPKDKRQFALDWMADRVQAAENGTDKRVGNPLGLLGWLINAILDGSLEPSSYGIRDNQPTNVIHNSPEDKTKTQQLWQEQMRQLGYRVGDNGQLVLLQLVGTDQSTEEEVKTPRKKRRFGRKAKTSTESEKTVEVEEPAETQEIEAAKESAETEKPEENDDSGDKVDQDK